MYKEKEENVEVYFICYKKEDMDLVESYYDEVLDVHSWYFNAYLAYKYWKNDFKDLEVGEIGKMLLIVAASRYLLYVLDEKEYKNEEEREEFMKDLDAIEPMIKKIIDSEKFLINL